MSTMVENRAVSSAWASLSKKLALVLTKLEKDQYLIISAKKSNRFVQFACQGEEGMRVEVTSNHFLKGKDRLNRQQISWLLENGWNAPTGTRKQSTPEKDPNGSPNYFIDFSLPVDASGVARQAIEALEYGLQIPDRGLLTYEAFGTDKKLFIFEELGLQPSTAYSNPLMEKVLLVFRQVTKIADLELDKDGDVMVFCDGLPIWATPFENKVRLFSVIITDLTETPALLHRINELNIGLHGVSCAFRQDRIYASADIFANPFVFEHFETALKEFSGTTQALASQLRNEFSEERAVDTAAPKTYIQ